MNEENAMKESSSIKEQIKKVSKALKVFTIIGKVACIVGICICVIGMIYTFACGNLDLIVLNGKVMLHSPLSSDFLVRFTNPWMIVGALVATIIELSLLIVLLRKSSKIFEDLSTDDTPFKMKQVKRIKEIAILYLIISIIGGSLGGITGSNFAFSLIGAGILWCISLVFEYGCELQKESDETL